MVDPKRHGSSTQPRTTPDTKHFEEWGLAPMRIRMRTVKAEAERDELRRIGDHMQSEASRLATWMRRNVHPGVLPYEVRGALHGVEASVDEWTEERRHSAASQGEDRRA